MPTHPALVKLLASADQHKERGYELISQYLNTDGTEPMAPELWAIVDKATALQTSDDDTENTVGNLVFVALVGYMERFETERMNDATE